MPPLWTWILSPPLYTTLDLDLESTTLWTLILSPSSIEKKIVSMTEIWSGVLLHGKLTLYTLATEAALPVYFLELPLLQLVTWPRQKLWYFEIKLQILTITGSVKVNYDFKLPIWFSCSFRFNSILFRCLSAKSQLFSLVSHEFDLPSHG